jgi:hypothetical protein
MSVGEQENRALTEREAKTLAQLRAEYPRESTAKARLAAPHQLRRARVLDDAIQMRNALMAEFEAAGMTKKEGMSRCWGHILAKFLPEGTEDLEGGLFDEESTPNLVRDILWAYDHLDNIHAMRSQSPSAGAWSLMKWARQYRNRFFEHMMPKALAAKKLEQPGQEKLEEIDPTIDEIDRLLKQVTDDFK